MKYLQWIHGLMALLGLVLVGTFGDLFDVLGFLLSSGVISALATRRSRAERMHLDLNGGSASVLWRVRWLGLYGCVVFGSVVACNHVEGLPDGELSIFLDLVNLQLLAYLVPPMIFDRLGRWVWAAAFLVCLLPAADLPPAAMRTALVRWTAEEAHPMWWATRVNRQGAFVVYSAQTIDIYQWEGPHLRYDRSAHLIGHSGGSRDSQWLRPMLAAWLIERAHRSSCEALLRAYPYHPKPTCR